MLELEEQIRRHATWVRTQMPALDDPTEAGSTLVFLDAQARRRPGRRSWLAVAAVALLAVLVGVGALIVSRSSGGGGSHSLPAVAATGGDSLLIPPTPDGTQLWSIGVSPPSPATTTSAARVDQLFGRDGQARVEVVLDPEAGDKNLAVASGIPQTIRGQHGWLYMADQQTSEVSSPQSIVQIPLQGASDQLIWWEHGEYITARFRDMTSRQALDFVDGMTWATQVPADGFVAPAGSGLTTLLPATPQRATGLGQGATFTYAALGDRKRQVVVTTCPDGIGVCPAAFYDYADVWFHGTRQADGSASAELTGDDPATGRDSGGRFVEAWPGGGTVDVVFYGQGIDLGLAQRLVGGVERTDTAGLRTRQAGVSARLSALAPAVVAELPNGQVDVRRGAGVEAVCLQPTGLAPTCSITSLGYAVLPPLASAEVGAIDPAGHWWQAGVMTGPGQLSIDEPGPPGDVGSATTPLPGQAATTVVAEDGRTYQVALAQVPDAMANVMIRLTNGTGSNGFEVGRPGA